MEGIMKYCTHCGAQLDDAAVVCPGCGCATDEFAANSSAQATVAKDNTLNTVIKVFMILGCLSYGWLLVPLAWTIPMTVSFFNKVRDGRKVGVGFKVCTLLFVNLIAGICLLCRDESGYID